MDSVLEKACTISVKVSTKVGELQRRLRAGSGTLHTPWWARSLPARPEAPVCACCAPDVQPAQRAPPPPRRWPWEVLLGRSGRKLRSMAVGRVAFWHGDEGWGAISAPDRPGVGFAHFSHIRGVDGYRELFRDEEVEFEWADDHGQDGCQWRVAWARPLARGAEQAPADQ